MHKYHAPPEGQKTPAPISFFDLPKLTLDFMGRPRLRTHEERATARFDSCSITVGSDTGYLLGYPSRKRLKKVTMAPIQYRPDIDGLRALAILLVTIFHFNLFDTGKAGFIGVDVFFVISGFLITSIIVNELNSGDFQYTGFLYRRFRRLYPAMLFTLILYLALGYFLFLPDLYEELGFEALLSQLYVVNIYFWRSVNYFGLQAGSVPLLHMWSLAVEEQFYLLFPLFCAVVYRFRKNWLFGAIVLATLGSFLLGLFATPWKPWASFYLLPTRAWELLIGGVLALALQRHPVPRTVLVWASPIGLFLVMAAIFLYTPVSGIPGWFALLPTLGAVLLILGGLNSDGVITRCFSIPALVWIGRISYPLYLVHWPIMITLQELLLEFTLPWRFFGFFASFAVAWLIYAYVETPIRHGKIAKSPRQYVIITSLLTASVIGISTLVSVQKGLPSRFDPDVNEALTYLDDSAKRFMHCEGQLGNKTCLLGDKNQHPEFLIVGDSHANAYAHAFDIWLKREGRSAAFSFANGCLPVPNIGGQTCNQQMEAAKRFVQENSTITTVVLSSIWRQPYGTGSTVKGQWTTGVALEQAFEQELVQLVDDYVGLGKDIVLIDPLFSAPKSAPRTLAANRAFDRNWPEEIPRAVHDAEFAKLFSAFERAVALGAQRISIIDSLCGDHVCHAVREGAPIFTDSTHLADWMSQPVASILEDAFSTIEAKPLKLE